MYNYTIRTREDAIIQKETEQESVSQIRNSLALLENVTSQTA